MRSVDVYLLDWNGRRPSNAEGVWDAFNAGRYEYSFSLPMDPAVSPIAACEHAYMRQQDVGFKTRQDRQSMSTGDVVVLNGTAYYCAVAGFKEVPGLATQILSRIERSWDAWTAEPEPEPPINGAWERVQRAEAAEARMSHECEWVVDPEEVDVPNPDLLASMGDALRDAEAGN